MPEKSPSDAFYTRAVPHQLTSTNKVVEGALNSIPEYANHSLAEGDRSPRSITIRSKVYPTSAPCWAAFHRNPRHGTLSEMSSQT
jgi:hypothetical protein